MCLAAVVKLVMAFHFVKFRIVVANGARVSIHVVSQPPFVVMWTIRSSYGLMEAAWASLHCPCVLVTLDGLWFCQTP